MGMSIAIVRKPVKPIPEKVATIRAREWAKEGKKVHWEKIMPQQGFQCIAAAIGGGAHLLAALSEQEDEPRDYEWLCASAEAFVYAAMIRLMVRRLARG